MKLIDELQQRFQSLCEDRQGLEDDIAKIQAELERVIIAQGDLLAAIGALSGAVQDTDDIYDFNTAATMTSGMSIVVEPTPEAAMRQMETV